MTQRVVVTGIGPVTPLGTGVTALWDAVLGERVAVGEVTRFPVDGYASRNAAEIAAFDPSTYMERKRMRWTDRFSQFAIAASRLALDDARFEIGDGIDMGVYIGSALGGLAYAEEQHELFRAQGLEAVRPLLAISVFGGAATCNVAIELGIHGPNVANGNSCASGTVAIGEAFRAIARGEIRAALAGGCEAPLSPLVYGAFSIIGAMSRRNDAPAQASRPFDRGRDGFVMGEGAAMLVLERYEDAVNRGAPIYGEITGYGLTNDAHHMSSPHPGGDHNARAMRNALGEAHLVPDEIEAVNAHGSATPLGDRGEALALHAVFGDRTDRVPVTATKGQHGHALGATGAWEAALSLLALARGVIPRTVNYDTRDPECDLAVTGRALPTAPRIIISNSAGFGGINAALVLRQVA
jgi:3-oxoacyl-[acyl-carrier-protein] synthase II